MSDDNVYTHLDPESRSGTSKSKNKSMQEDEMLNDISQKVHFVKQTPIEQPPLPKEPIVQESQELEPKEQEPKEQEMTLREYWRLQSQKPKYKEWKKQYQKDYYQKNKEKLDKYQKEYNSRPEVKERMKEYDKKYMQEYNKRPEVKEQHLAYMREYKKRPEVIERNKQSLTEKRHKQRLALGAISLPKPSRILHTRNAYIYTDKETYDKAVEMNKQVLPGRKKIILFRDPQIEKERIRQNRIFLRLKRKK